MAGGSWYHGYHFSQPFRRTVVLGEAFGDPSLGRDDREEKCRGEDTTVEGGENHCVEFDIEKLSGDYVCEGSWGGCL